jgi:hypothetical protein
MPDFNADAHVFVARMQDPAGRHAPHPMPKPVHSGSAADCIAWTLAKHDGYPETYSIVVPHEAGFGKEELPFKDIEEWSRHPQFPR